MNRRDFLKTALVAFSSFYLKSGSGWAFAGEGPLGEKTKRLVVIFLRGGWMA